MNGLLGKIASITPEPDDAGHLKIAFRAACLLPQRKPVPEWLKGQVLSITRTVRDAREVGRIGDSIILTPEEAARWLYPLEVTPAISVGEMPSILQLRWHWWKSEPSPATVRVNGRTVSVTWQAEGEGWMANVETSTFFDAAPRLPITFEIACEGLKGESVVQPVTPWAASLLLRERAIERLENDWYQLDITARSHGGAITALREQGRDADHFRGPDGLIAPPLDNGGHADGFKTGWGDWSGKMKDAAMNSRGARRESAATRLTLEGVVDEGEGLRTSLSCTMHDEWPLLLWQREWSFGAKKDDKKDEVREPIDDLRPMQPGFRAAALPERDGASGSRILCSDGERMVAMRPVQAHEQHNYWNWTMKGGWAMLEHPHRRECLLYLFDTTAPPHLGMWRGPHTLMLEPFWEFAALKSGESIGFSLAISAGELCGAAPNGAWVACRAPAETGSVRIGVVARLDASIQDRRATVVVGGETREVPLQNVWLPGVGEIGVAVTTIDGIMNDDFDVTVAGIKARRSE